MFSGLLNEFKKIKTDKLIIFVIVIIPLFVNLILGWELSGEQIRHIPMAVIDQDNSPLSRMIIEYFSQNEFFNLNYYVQDEKELEELIKSNKVRTGLIIPKDFSKDIIALKSPTILMIYDGSHMSIASTAKSKASEILLTLRTGVAIKQISARYSLPEDVATNIATAIKFNNTTLYNPAKSFKNFLTPGFGISIVQSGIVLMAAVAVEIEEIKNRKRRLLSYFIEKVCFYGTIGTFSMMLSVFVQSVIFKVPFRGHYFDAFILCMALAFSASSFAVMISAWIDNKAIAIVANGLFFIPSSILAGYTWPIMAMPAFYKMFSNIIPFTFVASNIRDVYLKGASITSMSSDLIHLLLYFLTTLILGTIGISIRKGEIKSEPILETIKI